MISRTASVFRRAIPAYLSLFGILSSYRPANSNPDYVDRHPIRTALFEKIFDNISVIFGLLLLWALIEIAHWLKNQRGRPKEKELIKFILNQYRDKAFNIQPGDSEDHHRVTLFKYKKRHIQFRSSHWRRADGFIGRLQQLLPHSCLVMFLRSGRLSQDTNVVFPVYDESDKANGWAAHVWSTGCAGLVDHLPDTETGGAEEYAARTKSNISVVKRYLAAKRRMPRAIAAIPVEVHGVAWGVLVLDSRRPDGLSNDSIDNFKITVAAIQKILEVRP